MIDSPHPHEKEQLVALARETGFFSPVEVDVVGEMLEEFFDPGPTSDYIFKVFRDEPEGAPLGLAAYGPVPMTEGTYDLYWIAVDRAHQNKKIGRALLSEVEADLKRRGARQLYIETSDTPHYAPTRAFYDRTGYTLAAHFPEFYKPGDGKVVYVKNL